jgi:hypothetical protein
MPKLEQLCRVPLWQTIGGQTLTAGAPGRGFWRICIQEIDGPRQHDLPDGINFHLRKWIYKADDKGNLQGCLLEDQEN